MRRGVASVLISVLLGVVPGVANACPYALSFPRGPHFSAGNQALVKVVNHCDTSTAVEFFFEKVDSNERIPSSDWRSNISLSVDEDILRLKGGQTRFVAFEVRYPGNYYLCHGKAALEERGFLATVNCKLIRGATP